MDSEKNLDASHSTSVHSFFNSFSHLIEQGKLIYNFLLAMEENQVTELT